MLELSEVWSKVPDYEEFYEVSNFGQFAKILSDGRQIRKLNVRTPYVSVSVKSLNGGPQKSLYIHKLVAQVFIGNRPDGFVIRHLDGNKYNNRVDNLAYGTVQQNALDSVKHKTHWHENNGRALLTERSVNAIRFLYQQKSINKTDLAKAFNVSISTIHAIIKGRNWK
jgi:hypothetical protein